jgi:AAA15 family ATPase/GTPase
MIKELTIKNFKSIRELKIPCNKLNVFIGSPNSGKSNIIEALALRSQDAIGQKISEEIFRFKTIGDLFYDFNITNPIEVISEGQVTVLEYAIRKDGAPENQFHFMLNAQTDSENPSFVSHEGKVNYNGQNGQTNVHFYEFKRLTKFEYGYLPHLQVPHGDNLPSLLLSNSEYKKWVSEFLRSKNLTLTIKPTENDIMVSKIVDGLIYSYPYLSLSETLQRIIFYSIAIKSNKSSIILFDEPESNTFPFYTKYLAEKIALDKTNQFFITTHNPYLLLSLIEKSDKDKINVSVVQMIDHQTEITLLNDAQLSEVLDLNSDVFFNFDKILDK